MVGIQTEVLALEAGTLPTGRHPDSSYVNASNFSSRGGGEVAKCLYLLVYCSQEVQFSTPKSGYLTPATTPSEESTPSLDSTQGREKKQKNNPLLVR